MFVSFINPSFDQTPSMNLMIHTRHHLKGRLPVNLLMRLVTVRVKLIIYTKGGFLTAIYNQEKRTKSEENLSLQHSTKHQAPSRYCSYNLILVS